MFHICQTIMFIAVITLFGGGDANLTSPVEWRAIEDLAEDYPYIAALLDKEKRYFCTGLIIRLRTVLTTGNCVRNYPRFVAHGAAVIDKHINTNALLEVLNAVIHPDYMFEMIAGYNITNLHSNIGLVFTKREFRDFFNGHAYLGNYFASELIGKVLTVIGYTEEEKGVLHKISYRQAACTNPKWYYCVCGYEVFSRSMHDSQDKPLGEGAPVFYGNEMVAITAAKCGILELPVSNVKYNIFTVLGPYIPWMNRDSLGKERHDTMNFRSRQEMCRNLSSLKYKSTSSFLKYIWIFIIFSKFFI